MRARISFAGLLLFAGATLAADYGLFGNKVSLRERPGRTPRSDLTCKDVAVTLPAPGSPGDPSVAGVDVDVTVTNGGGASIAVPGGTGWTVKSSAPPSYAYKNPSAPQGGSPVRKLLLRGGKLVKLQVRGVAIGAASPSGGVQVVFRLVNGDRLCAAFQQTDMVKDAPGTLIGRNAAAPTDCGSTTSTTVPTTTTTVTTPTTSTTIVLAPCGFTGPGGCGGPCQDGECMAVPTFSDPSLSECLCVPPNVVPCMASGFYPTCGQACAAGETCAPFRYDRPGLDPITVCACVPASSQCSPAPSFCSPGVCASGLVCTDQHELDPSFCGCGAP